MNLWSRVSLCANLLYKEAPFRLLKSGAPPRELPQRGRELLGGRKNLVGRIWLHQETGNGSVGIARVVSEQNRLLETDANLDRVMLM